MKVAILSRAPGSYSTRRLREAALNRGHEAEVLDTLKFSLELQSGTPDLYYGSEHLDDYDAVIPRIGASITGLGVPVPRNATVSSGTLITVKPSSWTRCGTASGHST